MIKFDKKTLTELAGLGAGSVASAYVKQKFLTKEDGTSVLGEGQVARIGTDVAPILLGLFIIIAVLSLYFLRTIKYDLSRDIDIFFTTIGLIYSSILIIHGWRLDPILLFGQILIIISILAIGWENIRLRGLVARKSVDFEKN